MNRFSTVLWILAIVVASFMLYQMKYRVQSLERQVAETTRQLEAEKEALHVASAEWAYLNRPERLKRLADTYLGSSDITVKQVASIQQIPFPERMEAALSDDQLTPASFRMTR